MEVFLVIFWLIFFTERRVTVTVGRLGTLAVHIGCVLPPVSIVGTNERARLQAVHAERHRRLSTPVAELEAFPVRRTTVRSPLITAVLCILSLSSNIPRVVRCLSTIGTLPFGQQCRAICVRSCGTFRESAGECGLCYFSRVLNGRTCRQG